MNINKTLLKQKEIVTYLKVKIKIFRKLSKNKKVLLNFNFRKIKNLFYNNIMIKENFLMIK